MTPAYAMRFAALLAVLFSASAFAQTNATCSFRQINLPGDLTELPGPLFADAGLNNIGAIVGAYAPPASTNTSNAFLQYQNVLVPFQYPGSHGTVALSINNRSQIVGYYLGSPGFQHGFVVRSGSFQPVDVPGSSATVVDDINDAGAMVGQYVRPEGATGSFLQYRGQFATFNFPGTLGGTVASGINNNSVIVGTYSSGPHWHGFTVRNGSFAKLDYPRASNTELAKVNDNGVIVGSYDIAGPSHGFAYAKGKFTTIDYSGAVATGLVGLNKFSQVIGWQIPATGGLKLFVGDCRTAF